MWKKKRTTDAFGEVSDALDQLVPKSNKSRSYILEFRSVPPGRSVLLAKRKITYKMTDSIGHVVGDVGTKNYSE